MTLGPKIDAIVNKVLTRFSPSPIHLLVRLEAEILKKVDPDSLAMAFPIIVFPVPGGPKRSTPLGGAAKPLNNSGFYLGKIRVSNIIYFANSNPAISSQLIFNEDSKILLYISFTKSGSKPLNRSSMS